MIGNSKNNRENYLRKCFWTQEKETWVKLNPGLSANRPSNNWALKFTQETWVLCHKNFFCQMVLHFPRLTIIISWSIWYFRTTQVGENPENEVVHPSDYWQISFIWNRSRRPFPHSTSNLFCHPKPGVSWCLCSQRCGNNLFQITKTDTELRERKVDLETSFSPSIPSWYISP